MRIFSVLVLAWLVHPATLYAVEVTIYPDQQRSSISNNSFEYTIPSRSAFHFVLYADESASAPPEETPVDDNPQNGSADTSDGGGGGGCFITVVATPWRR